MGEAGQEKRACRKKESRGFSVFEINTAINDS
jgi:hypothetical protein